MAPETRREKAFREMHEEASKATAALREAAGRIEREPILSIAHHADLSKPIRHILLSAAEEIEMKRRVIGLPVNYALELAGLILGEDLGHNR